MVLVVAIKPGLGFPPVHRSRMGLVTMGIEVDGGVGAVVVDMVVSVPKLFSEGRQNRPEVVELFPRNLGSNRYERLL